MVENGMHVSMQCSNGSELGLVLLGVAAAEQCKRLNLVAG